MIGALENAIIARLQAASQAGTLGYTYRTLASHPVNWDAQLRDKVIRAPGAWVVFAGIGQCKPIGFGHLSASARFGLIVMAENARNETAQRHGGPVPAEPGSYQMMMDAVRLLHGWTPDVDGASAMMAEHIHVVRTAEITSQRNISLMAAEFAVPISVTAYGKLDASEMGDFSTFHIDWDICPFGNIDASDTVTLPVGPSDA